MEWNGTGKQNRKEQQNRTECNRIKHNGSEFEENITYQIRTEQNRREQSVTEWKRI